MNTASSKPVSATVKQQISDAVQAYLVARPPFFCLIRPQEIALFLRYTQHIRHPILDFGCGDGIFAQVLADIGLKKTLGHDRALYDTGVDVPDSQIEDAKQRQIYQNLVTYDGATLPFPDGSFQTVISNCVLEHIPRVDQSIQEIYRVLKPGGIFLTGVMTDQWDRFLLGAKFFGSFYQKRMREQQDHHSLFSLDQWQNAFEQPGFTVLDSVGYLDPTTAGWLDLAHYGSIGSLIAKAVTGTWTPWPDWYRFVGLAPLMVEQAAKSLDCDRSTSSAVFFVLQKPVRSQ